MGSKWSAGGRLSRVGGLGLAVLLAAAFGGIFCAAPTEASMGPVQKILYVHVGVAWFSLVAFLIAAGAGAAYLARRDLGWDSWAEAAGEVGWLCATLTLLSGSLWARQAWGTWWTWDPRLTTAFVLWALYGATFVIRGNIDEPHRRARAGAVLAIVGVLDVPLVVMASRWFRGIHPATPEMEPAMKAVLLLTIAALTALFGVLLARRRSQIRLEHRLAALEEVEEEIRAGWR